MDGSERSPGRLRPHAGFERPSLHAALPPTMCVEAVGTRFDVGSMPPLRRRLGWANLLNEYFYDYDIHLPGDFDVGALSGATVGDLKIATVHSDPMTVQRSMHHIERDPLDGYFLLLPTAGRIALSQRGRDAEVMGGEFVFVATTEAYRYVQTSRETFHNVIIPGAMIRSRRPDADDFVGFARARCCEGLTRIFVDYAMSLCRGSSTLAPAQLRLVTDNFLDLFALVLAGGDVTTDESSVQSAHRRRVRGLIERRFSDPDLTVAALSKEIGLSERYLQRLFARSNESISDLIRDRRVMEAKRLLSARRRTRKQIAAIAFDVGFKDPAYFSRVFKAAMGATPSGYEGSG